MIDWALERDLERSLAAALATRARIAGFVRETPLVEAADGLLLKLETLQRSGSFKIRGAAAALTAGPRPQAVVAASTGNHGLAVAEVARALALPCRVFVPAGLELLEQAREPPEELLVPVGGGGLIGGVALAVRERWADCRIVGCLPEASPAMAAAVAAGEVVDAPCSPTLSDATAGNLEPGAITVPLCAALVDELVTLPEERIAAAVRLALLEHHLVVEGAAALALAAARERPARRRLVVLSGGNVSATALAAAL